MRTKMIFQLNIVIHMSINALEDFDKIIVI